MVGDAGLDPSRVPRFSDIPDLQSTTERTIVDLRRSAPFVSVGHYRYLAAHDPLPLQMHSRLCVIAFAVRSRFDFMVNGGVVSVEPGESILIPPGNTYSTGLDAQTRGELTWLVLDASRATATRSGGSAAIRDVVLELVERNVTKCRSPQLTLDLLSRVLTDGSNERDGSDVWRGSLCAAALVDLWRFLKRIEPENELIHPGLRRAVGWATANIDTAISASDMIVASGISSTRFYELFRETYGTSPKDYVLRMKIERAAELLRSSPVSVTELSHRLGFSSSQHFSTSFRRYFGSSPSRFREQAASKAVGHGTGYKPGDLG